MMEGISKKIYLELKEPTEEDSRSGQKRILDALKEQGIDGEMTLDAMRKLYPLCEQEEWKFTVSLAWDGRQWMLVDIEPGNTENRHYGLAVDLGSTTVVTRLIDCATGEEVEEVSRYNKQIAFGTDILTRIFYAKDTRSALEELRTAAVATICGNMKEIKEKTGLRTNIGYNHETLPEYWLRAKDQIFFEEGKLGAKSPEDINTIFALEEQAVKEGWHGDPSVFTEITIGSAEQDPMVYGSSEDSMSWCAFAYSNQLAAIQQAAPDGVEIGITTWPSDDLTKSNYLKPSQFFAVTTDCKNPEEAVKVLDYITNSVECNKVLLGERGVPISQKVSEAITPELDETNQKIVRYINEVVTPSCTTINPAAPNGANEVYDLLKNLEEQVLYGQISADDAAKQLFEEGNAFMEAGAQ